jgi:hypothetical protein
MTTYARRNTVVNHIATELAPVRTIAYSFGSSLSRGGFWPRCTDRIELCIMKSVAQSRPGWSPRENPHRLSPGSNRETYRYRA